MTIKTTVTGKVIKWESDIAGVAPLTFDTAKAGCDAHAALTGYRLRVDRASALGKGATDAEKIAAMRRVVEHYETGTDVWTMAAGVGGDVVHVPQALADIMFKGKLDKAESHIEAMMKKSGKDRAGVLAYLKTRADIIRAVADIKAKRAPDGGDAMLDEMMATASE